MSLIDEHQLSNAEKQLVKRWWQDGYETIVEEGYRLDYEYIPSASTSRLPASRRSFNDIVNSGLIISAHAHRERDHLPVTLTCVPLESPVKLPPNCCVQPYHMLVLDSETNRGSHKIMVTPALCPIDKLRFENFRDFLNFFNQISKALHSMHKDNIAYRACTAKSIVVIDRRPEDEQYQFYFGDFGFSCKYDNPDETDKWPRERKGFAPEHESEGRYNPFRTDIYYIGLLVREKFLKKFRCFKDMSKLVDLVNEMTYDEPSGRPVIGQVVCEFASIQSDLSKDAHRPLESSSWWHWFFRR